jgi:plasmid stabilization system protein ParE
MAKKIIWSKRALKERFELFDYWNKRNKSTRYSLKLNQQIKATTYLLSMSPLIGKKTDIEAIRIKIIEEYLLFYEIQENQIIILSIKDGRQHPDKMKLLQ